MVLRVSSLLFVLASASTFFVAPAVPRAQGVLAAAYQLQTPGQTYGGVGDALIAARGQVFTAEVAGQLVSVSLRTGYSGAVPATVTIAIHALDGSGIPISPPLTAKGFTSDLLPAGNLEGVVEFDMSDAPTQLQQGLAYAIVMTVDPISDGLSPAFLNGSSGAAATYAGGRSVYRIGTSWTVSEITDYHFEVRVDDMVSGETTTFGAQKARYTQ